MVFNLVGELWLSVLIRLENLCNNCMLGYGTRNSKTNRRLISLLGLLSVSDIFLGNLDVLKFKGNFLKHRMVNTHNM